MPRLSGARRPTTCGRTVRACERTSGIAEVTRCDLPRLTGGQRAFDTISRLGWRAECAPAAPSTAARFVPRPVWRRAAGRATDLGVRFGGNAVLEKLIAGEFGEPHQRNPGGLALVSSWAALVLTVDTRVS
jgi:hypothetical protein